MDCSTPGLPVHHQLQSLLKLMSIESVMPSNHLILCRPLLLLPSIFPSIRVFSNESVLPIRWPQYWSFSFIISPLNEHSGLISFRMDWFDLLAVHGTLKSRYQILLPKQITVKWGLLELVPSANQHLLSRANRFHKRNGCMISGKKKCRVLLAKAK